AELVAMLAAAADRLPGGPVAEFPRGVSGRVAVAETDGRQAHRAGEGGSPPSSHGAGAMIEDSAAGPVEGGTVDPEAAARVPVASEGGESFGDFEAPSGPAPARTADDGDRGHERARPVPAPLREPRGGEPDVRVRARPEPLPELNEPASAPERSARPETSERSAAEPAAPADEGAVRRRGPQRRFVGGRPLTGRER
ncbi:MAG TPA: hypothetical protein VD963_05880, partial [Phycisphaerales bacterium]|nr:hypothetical protein [Phycisphaerales bacterium]